LIHHVEWRTNVAVRSQRLDGIELEFRELTQDLRKLTYDAQLVFESEVSRDVA
jgi:hypothetical protein